MSPTPSDEDEYDELDDDIEDSHQEVDAIRPVYVRDKLGQYTTSDTWSSSGTMAQMIQQAATKNLQSEYVPEYGEALDEEETIEENAMDSLKKIVSRQTAETIRLADGSRLQVDMTTANALLGVHGALNIHNQKKMADTLNSNKAGFAKMAKFAFKQFGSRPGKVGIPNTGVQEGSLKLAKKPFDAGDDKIGPNDKAKKREARELTRSTGPSDQGGRGRATGSWGDRGKGSTPARGSGNRGATTRPHARDLRNKRTDYSEYTPDHGETFAEDDANAQRIAARAAIQKRVNASRKRGGLTSAGHRDMTRRVAAGKHDPTQSSSQNPSGSYSRGEQKAAQVRAAANRAKRAAARRGAPAEEYVGEASDEKEYDNHPWTKGDLSPKQVRAKLDLAKKIAKERARKRLGGGSPDVEYDDKIGRG
jgi:hypothetical protein